MKNEKANFVLWWWEEGGENAGAGEWKTVPKANSITWRMWKCMLNNIIFKMEFYFVISHVSNLNSEYFWSMACTLALLGPLVKSVDDEKKDRIQHGLCSTYLPHGYLQTIPSPSEFMIKAGI